MLENYKIDEYRVISQIEPNVIPYGYEYNDKYNGEIYKKGSDILNGLRLGFTIGSITSDRQISPIEEYKLLDIGYGNGDFLKLASNFFECSGYDISEYPVPENCKKVYDLNGKYDIVTMWDSFEHIKDNTFIKDLDCEYIVLSVPYCHYNSNIRKFNETIADKLFEQYRHFRPDEHIYHYDQWSLSNFMSSCGYELVVLNSSLEDIVRKNGNCQNILTACYHKVYIND